MAETQPVIFITGGVRSGKSSIAEQTAARIWRKKQTGKLHYIATMQVSDGELKERVAIHKRDRLLSKLPWQTWEQPVSLGRMACRFHPDDTVLLDCLTTWVNNELFYNGNRVDEEILLKQIWEDFSAIANRVHKFVVVSNEVFYEPLGDRELVIRYCRLLGKLHQKIVAHAEQAVLVEAGVPVFMKGGKGL